MQENKITSPQILITVSAASAAEITKLFTALRGFIAGIMLSFFINLPKIKAIKREEKMCEKKSIHPSAVLLKTPLPTAKTIKAGPAFMQ